jgi:uncharacterized protein
MQTAVGFKLCISPELSLPLNAITQRMGALGISGSGKSYGMGKLVEELLRANAQVVIIDNVGVWYGLRLDADGVRPGFSIPIFGGQHGDAGLDPRQGAYVAEQVAATRSSMVLDISEFVEEETEQFVTEFATALLLLKKRHKSPMLVVWEECQDIAPQVGGSRKMLRAVERLVKTGRNHWIGNILISQRAAAVNKNVLNQVDTLFCFRQSHTLDRKAIKDWVVSKAVDVPDVGKAIVELEDGTCYCWSPKWLKLFKKIKFGRKTTFDSTATPEFGEALQPAGKLAPVDLAKFAAMMTAPPIDEGDAEALKARILELEVQLRSVEAPVPVLTEQEWEGLKTIAGKLAEASTEIKSAAVLLDSVARSVTELQPRSKPRAAAALPVARPTGRTPAPVRYVRPAPEVKAAPAARPRVVRDTAATELGDVKKCPRALLVAISQLQPKPATDLEVSIVSGYLISVSTFRIGMADLAQRGYVDGDSSGRTLTAAGEKFVAALEPPPVPNGATLLQEWQARLLKCPGTFLGIAAKAYPQWISLDELAKQSVVYKREVSTFRIGLAELTNNSLLSKDGEQVRAAPLFDQRRRQQRRVG